MSSKAEEPASCAKVDCGWYRTTVALREVIKGLRANALTPDQADFLLLELEAIPDPLHDKLLRVLEGKTAHV